MTTETNQSKLQPALSAVARSPSPFKGLRIKHHRIAQMMSELQTLIYPDSQESILLVCGPSGVGKSTLGRYMVERALAESAVAMNGDAGLVPAVYVQAPSSGEDNFSWRLFYQRILRQLEPEINVPKSSYGIDERTGRMVYPQGQSSNSLGALRDAVERALKERGTYFTVVDEAAHIIRQTRRNRLEIQLDTIKSLANDGRSQMVLIGSYDLYQLVSLSGQLARRTHVMHFERYRQDSSDDVLAFKACVQKFEDALPNLWRGKLVQHSDALMDNTLGCVGTLSDVLTLAAKLAQADGKWSVEALRKALLTEAQRNKILEEILEGEQAINPSLTRTMLKPGAAASARISKRAA